MANYFQLSDAVLAQYGRPPTAEPVDYFGRFAAGYKFGQTMKHEKAAEERREAREERESTRFSWEQEDRPEQQERQRKQDDYDEWRRQNEKDRAEEESEQHDLEMKIKRAELNSLDLDNKKIANQEVYDTNFGLLVDSVANEMGANFNEMSPGQRAIAVYEASRDPRWAGMIGQENREKAREAAFKAGVDKNDPEVRAAIGMDALALAEANDPRGAARTLNQTLEHDRFMLVEKGELTKEEQQDPRFSMGVFVITQEKADTLGTEMVRVPVSTYVADPDTFYSNTVKVAQSMEKTTRDIMNNEYDRNMEMLRLGIDARKYAMLAPTDAEYGTFLSDIMAHPTLGEQYNRADEAGKATMLAAYSGIMRDTVYDASKPINRLALSQMSLNAMTQANMVAQTRGANTGAKFLDESINFIKDFFGRETTIIQPEAEQLTIPDLYPEGKPQAAGGAAADVSGEARVYADAAEYNNTLTAIATSETLNDDQKYKRIVSVMKANQATPEDIVSFLDKHDLIAD